MKILLIGGHGAGDPGATATINGVRYYEHTETRDVVQRLASALQGMCDVTVYPTDRNAYQDYQKGTLAAVAQFARYDYVLEIHFNAFTSSSPDGKTKGTEIYVTTSETGTGVEQRIVDNLAALGLTNRGVKRQNFAVIQQAKNAKTSSALLEVCFIDDPDDMSVYTKKRAAVTQAIVNGIRDGFGLKATVDPVEAAKQTIREKAGLEEKTIVYLQAYQYGDELLKKLAAAMR